MASRSLLALSLCAVVATPALAGSPATYDLRYKFRAGEVVRVEVTHQAAVDVTIKESNQTTQTRSGSVKAWKIEDVTDDGAIRFAHSVESVNLWQKAQGRPEVTYDSSKDATPPPEYEAAASSLGKTLTEFTINERGKVLKRNQTPTTEGGPADQILLQLPDHPIAVGEVWSSPQELDVTLPKAGRKKVHTRMQCKLERVEGSVATIQVQSQILTPLDDPQLEAQLIQRMAEGTVEFDVDAGRIVSQQLDVNRRIVGINGAGSVMHYEGRYTEKLLPPDELVGDRRSSARQ